MKRILLSTLVWTIILIGIAFFFGGYQYWQHDDFLIISTISFAAILCVRLFWFAFAYVLGILEG